MGFLNMSTAIFVEVAPGELIDKITILEIKKERMADVAKLENVHIEWEALTKARDNHIKQSPKMEKLTASLKAVNEELWIIEDDIRDCERSSDFSEKFVQLARAVYITNDKRAGFKRNINVFLGSRILEEKSYAAY
jgi:hypothetical protein